MRLHKAVLPSSSFTITLMGDLHIGSNGCHVEGIQKVIDNVASTKRSYFVSMGDNVDAVCTDDKRYHYVKGDSPLPLQQCATAVELLKPAAKKCLLILKGNHEDTLHRFGDITCELIAKPLGAAYGGYVSKLGVYDKHGLIFKAYLWHGPMRGAISSKAKDYTQRQANMKASVRRYLENKASDCAILAMGHSHLLLLSEPAPKLLMSDDGEKMISSYLPRPEGHETYIEPDRRWYVNTGSYLKSQILGDDSYAEKAGYDPIELGHAEVVVEDRKIVDIRKVVA